MTESARGSFFAELKRRKVVRVAFAYAGVAAAILETAERAFALFEIEANITQVVVISALAGLPIVLVLAWVFDLTSEGVVKTETIEAEGETGVDLPPGRFTWQLVTASVVVVLVMTGAGWRYLPNDRVDFVENGVAVARFTNLTGDEEFDVQGIIVADEITRQLNQIQGLQVAPRENYMAPQATTDDGAASSPVRALAERTKAAFVITGSYRLAGEDFVYQADVYDAIGDKVIWSPEPFRGDREDAPVELQEGLFGVMAGLAGGVTLVEAANVRGQSRPPLYAAYKQYALALDVFLSNPLARNEYLPHIDSAVSLDSTFVAAMGLSAYLRVRFGDVAGAGPILERLERMRPDLTPYERAGLDKTQAIVAGDLQGVYRFSNEVAELVGTSMSHLGAGMAALAVNRPREARAHFAEYDDDRILHREIYQQRALANHRLGRHGTEMRIVAQVRERIPTPVDAPWFFRTWELAAYAARGETPEELMGPELSNINVDIVLRTANELEVHGDPESAQQLRERVLAREEAVPLEEQRGNYRGFLGQTLSSLGRHEEAMVVFQGLIESNPRDPRPRVDAALEAARTGDRAYAEETIGWLEERLGPTRRGGIFFDQSKIAAALGDAEDAVQLLEQAEGAGVTAFDRLHMDPAFAPIRDHPAFQEYMKPRDEGTWWLDWLPDFMRPG